MTTNPLRTGTQTPPGSDPIAVVEDAVAKLHPRPWFIGWRLGTVFRSKLIPGDEVAFATEMSPRRRDGLLFLAVWVAWVVAVVALSGLEFVLLLSAIPGLYAMLQLRSQGPKAVGLFAALLAGLTVYWFVM